MAFPSIFLIFLIGALLFRHHLRKNTRIEDEMRAKFWREEERSLSVRKKEIPKDHFIQVNTDLIVKLKEELEPITPFTKKENDPDSTYKRDLSNYKRLIELLLTLSDEPKLNFNHMSNTEIRLEFGTANQTVIQNAEKTLEIYLKSLDELGQLYIKYKYVDYAIMIYEELLELGSDYKHHFMTLHDLYIENNRACDISRLRSYAERIQTLNGQIIINYLDAQ